MRYDWRNLLIEMYHWDLKAGLRPTDPVKYNLFKTSYYYDEAGSRICKRTYQWYQSQGGGDPIPDIDEIGEVLEGDNPTGSWTFVEAVYYIRDIAGREIAIYSGNTLEQCTKGVPSGEHVRIRQRWQY
ncbi:MAG: hypothetical protein K8I03_07300 [Ignavibacteria bacterium]|nr:hypothetical protein [Ignavibacteria bacterium]